MLVRQQNNNTGDNATLLLHPVCVSASVERMQLACDDELERQVNKCDARHEVFVATNQTHGECAIGQSHSRVEKRGLLVQDKLLRETKRCTEELELNLDIASAAGSTLSMRQARVCIGVLHAAMRETSVNIAMS